MKKIFSFLVILVLSFLVILPVSAKESDKITLYLFYGDGCPHCAQEKEFLSRIEGNYDNLEIVKYEVWKNKDNQKFMNEVATSLGVERSGVPLTVIGDTYMVGWSEALESRVTRALRFYSQNEYVDVVEQIKNGTYEKPVEKEDTDFDKEEEKSDEDATVKVPLLGKVNLKNVSLTTAAVILGLIDGFNPCAMWVLLFLISMLLGMKDKKRMWTIGLTFLGSSALVYMLIMLSWLNIVVSISTTIWVRNLIALIAIGGGIINLVNFFKQKDSGCSVVDAKKRKSVFARIKKFTSEKSLILALIGAVALAFSVNIIELACSAGLPMIYTQLLAINNVTGFSSFLYVLLYIVFFLMDDLVVFFIAMKTMEVTGFSTKYSKYSHLVGGLLMIAIGVLLIIKPEWLMFQF
ncbi:MAG: hypothetical protein IJA30_02975 [Bacilli bacterium]|nr:hypothetical protein [Bacilli bacterium]